MWCQACCTAHAVVLHSGGAGGHRHQRSLCPALHRVRGSSHRLRLSQRRLGGRVEHGVPVPGGIQLLPRPVQLRTLLHPVRVEPLTLSSQRQAGLLHLRPGAVNQSQRGVTLPRHLRSDWLPRQRKQRRASVRAGDARAGKQTHAPTATPLPKSSVKLRTTRSTVSIAATSAIPPVASTGLRVRRPRVRSAARRCQRAPAAALGRLTPSMAARRALARHTHASVSFGAPPRPLPGREG